MDKIANGDLIGSINGTIFGDAKLVPGINGLALLTLGSPAYVDLGYQGDTCLGNFTLCTHGWVTAFWVNPGSSTSGGVMDTGYPTRQGVEIMLEEQFLDVYFSTSSTLWLVYKWIQLRWVHVVATWQPCYGIKLYIDGKLEDAHANANAYTWQTDVVGNSRFVLGTSDEYFPRGFTGKLDELRIWDKVMSDEDVSALYNVDAGWN